MVTMATNNMVIMAKCVSIKSISIWAYGYGMHSVMDGGHIIGIIDHLAYFSRTQIQWYFALTTGVML